MAQESPKDLKGRKIKNFTVCEYVGIGRDKYNHKRQMWKCKCVCGKELILSRNDLLKPQIKSCGCLTNALIKNANITHGLSKTRLYHIWVGIKDRCYNTKSTSYSNYGERGIVMYEGWKDNFITFKRWALENGYSDELTIERIDYNGNYEPKNCCWIPNKDQCRNTRRNKYYTFNGETHSTVEWSIILGGTPSLVNSRLRRGWSLDKALSTPAKKGNYRYKDETRQTLNERRKVLSDSTGA